MMSFLYLTPCNFFNKEIQKPFNESNSNYEICDAMPYCYKNIFTLEGKWRGCGYSSYTPPEGKFWIRIS